MPRRARILYDGEAHHIIQRGNNRSTCFFTPGDYRYYLESLAKGAAHYTCAVHAYVLMLNHVHLLITPRQGNELSLLMRYLGSRYVRYANTVLQRSGTLWEGRFRSSVIESQQYLLTCYRYIESNPVRAGLVNSPAEYPWSSFHAHAYGQPDNLAHEHPCYLNLGTDRPSRQEAYRRLWSKLISSTEVTEIRNAVNSGLVLGSERFKDQVETALRRPVRAGKPGRPKKSDPAATISENNYYLQTLIE